MRARRIQHPHAREHTFCLSICNFTYFFYLFIPFELLHFRLSLCFYDFLSSLFIPHGASVKCKIVQAHIKYLDITHTTYILNTR